MKIIDVAGLNLSSVIKQEFLNSLLLRLKQGQKTSVITPYSEFLHAALLDPKLLKLFNTADFSLPDGIGVIWASKFLSLKLSFSNYYLKIVQAFLQMVYSGAAILLNRKYVYEYFPEKIVGADLFWDLIKIAEQNKFTIYLLGPEHDIPQKAKLLLESRYPNLSIVGFTNQYWNNPEIITEINDLQPDMVFVAFPARHQERWILENFPKLNIKFIIGLGGTLDYAVGNKVPPPKFIRASGLEWLYRLITQPTRVKRIWNAFIGLITALVRYKVFNSLPYRENAVAVIIDPQNKILICQRNPKGYAYGSSRTKNDDFSDYWQLPQGGVDYKEDIIAGARREAYEEVGLSNLEHFKTSSVTNDYIWNNAVRRLLFNHLKYKGQSQTIVYFKFKGSVSDVVLDNNEFVNYDWVNLSELSTRLHFERQSLVEIIIKELS